MPLSSRVVHRRRAGPFEGEGRNEREVRLESTFIYPTVFSGCVEHHPETVPRLKQKIFLFFSCTFFMYVRVVGMWGVGVCMCVHACHVCMDMEVCI